MMDTLGNRMKAYELEKRDFLTPKVPTIMRLDGKAFHTYTKGMIRPFDPTLIDIMDETAKYLCKNIQGVKFGFVQSDEITLFLSDIDKEETQMWYGGNVQKMVSVSASMATAVFNHLMFLHKFKSIATTHNEITRAGGMNFNDLIYACRNTDFINNLEDIQLANFDSRVFQVPNNDEVINNFIWRQQDAKRNSISTVASSLYSHKILENKNSDDKLQMIREAGDSWESYIPQLKWGRFIEKQFYYVRNENYEYSENTRPISDKPRTRWESVECPLFVEDKEFLFSKI